jgi:hypothetical protein
MMLRLRPLLGRLGWRGRVQPLLGCLAGLEGGVDDVLGRVGWTGVRPALLECSSQLEVQVGVEDVVVRVRCEGLKHQVLHLVKEI